MADEQQTERQESQHKKTTHDSSASQLNDNSNSGYEGEHKGVSDQATGDDTVAESSNGDEVEDKEENKDTTSDDNDGITVEALQKKIKSLEQSVADNLDMVLRAQAELDNIRKRSRRDVENAHKYSLEKFINELLPVLDSIDLGINAAENADDVAKLHEGMNLTMEMFLSSLEKFGVAQIAPQEGSKFDPEQHEAVSMQENNNVESGNIISVLQKGYQLNARLIRPVTVIVAK